MAQCGYRITSVPLSWLILTCYITALPRQPIPAPPNERVTRVMEERIQSRS